MLNKQYQQKEISKSILRLPLTKTLMNYTYTVRNNILYHKTIV